MPLWGSTSNHIPFTANATQGSSRLSNVVVGAGFTFSDLQLGQVVLGTGTTGIPYDSRIRNIGSNYIDITNEYIAGTGTTISFEANNSYKPEKALVGNKAFEGSDVFATEGGWVQRHYKRRIDFTGTIASGSTVITNVTVASGNTAGLQLGQLVGGVGVPGDPTDKKGVYIKKLLPAAGTGVTGIVLSDAANQSGVRNLNAYSYWDEVVVGIRQLSTRTAEPEVFSVSFNKTNYALNETGYIVVSFTEAVNVAGTGSSLLITTASGTGGTVAGTAIATYLRGSGTNKIYYSFSVGSTSTLSITPQAIAGTGATISGIDKNISTVTFTGDLTAGSRVVNKVSNITQLRVGYPVIGTGITSSTSITSISAGSSSITLSTSALSSGSTVSISVLEADARVDIYASHLVGAGSTRISIESQIPKYTGAGTSQIAYYGGSYVIATVA